MPDAESYRLLADALEARLAAISDATLRSEDPPAHLAKLRETSAEIDRLKPLFGADPTLAHYLERYSYDKALSHALERAER